MRTITVQTHTDGPDDIEAVIDHLHTEGLHNSEIADIDILSIEPDGEGGRHIVAVVIPL